MLDAKDIETLATTLRQHTEQLRVAEVAHNLADRFSLPLASIPVRILGGGSSQLGQ